MSIAPDGRDVQVAGTTPAYTWHEAQMVAMREVHRVASVLATALDTEIVIRKEAVRGAARPPGALPSLPAGGNVVMTPDWLADGLARSTGRLVDALSMRHQAVSLHRTHPSLALVCYVASIEAIVPPGDSDRCPECGGIRDSGKRFRAALARVAPASDGRGKRYYERRSRTVHDGRLHSSEMTFGWRMLGHLHPENGMQALMDLENLRRASRDLLVLELMGLPEWPRPARSPRAPADDDL